MSRKQEIHRPVEETVGNLFDYEEKLKRLTEVLNPMEYFMLYLLLENGMGPVKQAKLFGITRQAIEERLVDIRRKVRKVWGITKDEEETFMP